MRELLEANSLKRPNTIDDLKKFELTKFVPVKFEGKEINVKMVVICWAFFDEEKDEWITARIVFPHFKLFGGNK